MARYAVGLVLLFSAAFASAADPTGVTGYWKPESVVFDGQEQFPDQAARKAVTLVVRGGEYRVYYCTDEKQDLGYRLVTASIRVNPAEKSVELTVREGERKGQKCHGTYEVKDGKLYLCYGPADKPRPTEFSAPAGSGLFCEVWAPEKK